MGDDDGWDLQAVVKGCCGSAAASAAPAAEDPSSSFPPPLIITEMGKEEDEDWSFSFPDLCAAPADLHELEELCKPFISKTPQQQRKQQQNQKQKQKQSLSSPNGSSSSSASAFQLSGGRWAAAKPSPPQRAFLRPPASKRRKNQQKKVVCQVPADRLSSDLWAWRKYGQKPIKGSPFPRGYYKCSSSKGCLARKQVERSPVDPAMFIITYTAEHNHPIPTHRQKPPTSSSSGAANPGREVNAAAAPRQQASKASSSGSPPIQKEEDEEEEALHIGDVEMMSEDEMLFLDTGDGGAAFSDVLSEHFGAFPTPWLTSSAAAVAGGS